VGGNKLLHKELEKNTKRQIHTSAQKEKHNKHASRFFWVLMGMRPMGIFGF
jgi:hypothetical protein